MKFSAFASAVALSLALSACGNDSVTTGESVVLSSTVTLRGLVTQCGENDSNQAACDNSYYESVSLNSFVFAPPDPDKYKCEHVTVLSGSNLNELGQMCAEQEPIGEQGCSVELKSSTLTVQTYCRETTEAYDESEGDD